MKGITKVKSRNSNKQRASRHTCFSVARNEIGSAIVELALILPIFLFLMLGVVEFGRLAYASIEVSNAARAGVQFGAQSHAAASNISGMESAATNDAGDITSGVMTATATQFCTCSNGTTSDCSATSCTSPGVMIEYVQVNTTATVDPLFHYPGLPTTFTLQGQAIMRVEQ